MTRRKTRSERTGGALGRVKAFLAVVAIAALATAGAFVLLGSALAPAAAEGGAQIVIIPRGAPVQQIADDLAARGLIRSSKAFVMTARVRGFDEKLQLGEYALAPTMSATEIMEKLAAGDVVLHRVTIPEGYTLVQIADVLAGAGLVQRDEFLRVARYEGDTFDFPFVNGHSNLEGYLFPDTYLLPRGLTGRQVVARFLSRFEERITPDLRARSAAVGVTLHEAIIIASMVEREAVVPSERPVIAGVIYNRLRKGMRLEIDATVLYALGRHKSMVASADLRVDSRYNTYRYPGLPPGPIANPGLPSIQAALDPVETPYFFYVLRRDGSHAFSRTFKEHVAAIRKWRR